MHSEDKPEPLTSPCILYIIKEISFVDGIPTCEVRKIDPHVKYEPLMKTLTEMISKWTAPDREIVDTEEDRTTIWFKIHPSIAKHPSGFIKAEKRVVTLLLTLAKEGKDVGQMQVWSTAQMNYCRRRREEFKEHQTLLKYTTFRDPDGSEEQEENARKGGMPVVTDWQGWDRYQEDEARKEMLLDDED